MTLLNMSISAALMIIAVVIIRNVGRNVFSKNVIMCLWDIIILRALLPIRIPLEKIPFISDLFSKAENTVSIAEIPLKAVANQVVAPTAAAVSKGSLGMEEVVFIVWAIGAVISIGWVTLVYITKDRILRKCIPIENKVAARTIKKAGFHRRISLFINPSLTTAMTFGTIHPKIMLPPNITSLSDQDVRNMILHELQHIRTCDIFKRYIMMIAVSIHWFNPVIWILQKLYMDDQELACDERVVRNMSRSGYKSYATTLSLIGEINSEKASRLMGFKKEKATVVRIKQVLAHKKMGLCGIILSVLLFACSMMAFASYKPETDNQKSIMKNIRNEISEEKKTNKLQTNKGKVNSTEVTKNDAKEYEKSTVSDQDNDETEELSSEEYERIMKDIIDNYNDFSQELTQEQNAALNEYTNRELAKMRKEQLDNGMTLSEDDLNLVRKYYSGY